MKSKLKRNVMYGIWCEGYYWHCEGSGSSMTLYTKRAACRRAAEIYGFPSYSEAKRKGWCEVVEVAVSLFDS